MLNLKSLLRLKFSNKLDEALHYFKNRNEISIIHLNLIWVDKTRITDEQITMECNVKKSTPSA